MTKYNESEFREELVDYVYFTLNDRIPFDDLDQRVMKESITATIKNLLYNADRGRQRRIDMNK